MIYLDTNVVIWLAAHAFEEISQSALDIIEASDNLWISPMVELELQYLYEIKKITKKSDFILNFLSKKIGLEKCSKPFDAIITQALKMHWTRDPFDRIITANAAIDECILVTKDKTIKKHYKHVVW